MTTNNQFPNGQAASNGQGSKRDQLTSDNFTNFFIKETYKQSHNWITFGHNRPDEKARISIASATGIPAALMAIGVVGAASTLMAPLATISALNIGYSLWRRYGVNQEARSKQDKSVANLRKHAQDYQDEKYQYENPKRRERMVEIAEEMISNISASSKEMGQAKEIERAAFSVGGLTAGAVLLPVLKATVLTTMVLGGPAAIACAAVVGAGIGYMVGNKRLNEFKEESAYMHGRRDYLQDVLNKVKVTPFTPPAP